MHSFIGLSFSSQYVFGQRANAHVNVCGGIFGKEELANSPPVKLMRLWAADWLLLSGIFKKKIVAA